MARFIFAYHGGKAPGDPAEVEKVMAAWGAWFEGMGDKLKDPGGPVGQSSTVNSGSVADDGGANPISGFTVIEAASKDEAVEIAKGCPMVVGGSGSVEVAEVMQM